MKISQIMIVAVLVVSTMPTRSDAKITPDAENILRDVQAAYDNLRSMEITGTVSFHFDFQRGNNPRVNSSQFHGIYESPNKFRFESPKIHTPEIADRLPDISGCSGTVIYTDSVSHTHRSAADAPEGKLTFQELGFAGGSLSQCPPMNFAVVDGGAIQMSKQAQQGTPVRTEDIAQGPAITIDGQQFQTIVDTAMVLGNKQVETLVIDPQTHLVRRDILEQQTGPAKLTRTLDVLKLTTDQPIDEDRFRWTPPTEWFQTQAAQTQPTTQPATQTTEQSH